MPGVRRLMRLRQLKLAGFKSFVDPTTIPLPGEIVGVVGPNGCGKSNIIDAVRWVMGEISAKHLRGDSMADVVFNGSSARKPVGQASVELVFDNSQGLLGGRWAAYDEIAVRRQVQRDGQSAYFLNGVRCRRRDITDIFLGTGLGPRSYAIIEQGMITRLIEARPEELRDFLEEAAGISKYKERRRETENRIRHTRENLERLEDLRQELAKRLEHLQRQARAAERYKVLRQEERRLRAELLALRWRTLDEECALQERRIQEQETGFEAALAVQRRGEAALERQRQAQQRAQEEFNEVYRGVLDSGAEIARVEEAIRNLRLRREQTRESLAREERALDEARAHLTAEQEKLARLEEELRLAQPELDQHEQRVRAAQAEFVQAERTMTELQSTWEELAERAAAPAQQAQGERTRIQHLEDRLVQTRKRLTGLAEEAGGLRPAELAAEREALARELGGEEAARERLDAALAARQAEIHAERDRGHVIGARLDALRARLQESRGRLASLRALQEEALGKRAGAGAAWLRAHGLADAPRLAEVLEAASGWEPAIECALGPQLQAVCVSSLDALADALGSLEEGSVTLLETGPGDPCARIREDAADRLSDMVQAPGPAHELLAGVRKAASLTQALAGRAGLAQGESLMTAEGTWVGPHWLRISRRAGATEGVLAREHEIKSLAEEARRLDADIGQLQEELAGARTRVRELEQAHARVQSESGELHRREAALRARLSARDVELGQARMRSERIAVEVTELRERSAADESDLAAARARLERAADEMARIAAERSALDERRQQQRAQLEASREHWHGLRDEAYQAGLRTQAVRTQIAAIREGSARNHEQVAQCEARRAELQAAVAAGDAPLAEAARDLEQKLAVRREREQQLTAARRHVEETDAELRRLEHDRQRAAAQVQAEREVVERLRMEHQESRVRRQTVEEQLGETGHPLQELLAELPAEVDVPTWEGKLEHVERRIGRLGPINLAAIDEFGEQSERKRYLDAQYQDLADALSTLEEAIHKIDRETRARFKETYEKVNAGLASMFPRLFGGGRAYLQMTGEDLLSTGITLMAQPPGKRNSTIHLLSGGEKALSAVALVFAIFELNPAPFCLLDEVDAPLDDANVGRFCELVKDMSERVQFMLVTHNKTTMEAAQQLIGVTMNEPGVSRLVAVDVAEAVELAAV